jgi:hypothetical protein
VRAFVRGGALALLGLRFAQGRPHGDVTMVKVIELIAAALCVLWLAGVGPFHAKSDLIHVLLALGCAALLYRMIMGRHSTA